MYGKLRKKNLKRGIAHNPDMGRVMIPAYIKCTSGKLVFKSRKDAKRYLKITGMLHQSVYKCPVCALFHTTSCDIEEKVKVRELVKAD